MPDISLIIPVYNEEKRLFHLNEVYDYIASSKQSFETIVVSDGSNDQTNTILKTYKNITPIIYTPNRGKGYAIRQGMLAAKGKYCVFCDVDMSTPLSELKQCIPLLKKYDMVIGSRKIAGATVTQHQNIIREYMGKIFTQISRLALHVPVSDFTCGFKCFSRESAIKIFSHALVNRWGFDSEILFLAQKYKYSIYEVPVHWTNDERTKVRFPRDIFDSLNDIYHIRRNDMLGKYNP